MKTKEKTAELEKLKQGYPFVWGEVIKIHEIGDYAIVEAYGDEFKNYSSMGKIDYTHKDYHSYVGGEDCGHIFRDLDSALAFCIAYKYEGINTRAAGYFIKMIKREVNL